MYSVSPVIHLESSEAKKATAEAMSSIWLMRRWEGVGLDESPELVLRVFGQCVPLGLDHARG
jgi:hypothetical protein